MRHHGNIQVNGTELHYAEQGEGAPVIFVHGGLSDYRTWNPQLGPFSERYRAISYSRRGYYPNPWPEGYSACSLLEHVEDLAAFAAALHLPPAHIIGNSYGAYVSLVLAVEHPKLVRTLVLAEPPVHPLLPRLPGGSALFEEFMSRAWRPAGEAFARGDMEGGVRLFIEGAVGTGEYGKLPEGVRNAMMKNAPEMAVSTRTEFSMHMPDLTCEEVAEVRAPTLLLHGANSPRKYFLINDELARCIPDAEQAEIPDAAHVLHNHNPEAHNRIVLDFLARR